MFWKNKNKDKNIGSIGEKGASKFLKRKGFKIVELNYQNNKGRRLGEVDIIARKDRELVFVEVKSRKTENLSVLPEENIDRRKLYRLQKIAQAYLRKKNIIDMPYRFDAVSVWISPCGDIVKIKHLESIFL